MITWESIGVTAALGVEISTKAERVAIVVDAISMRRGMSPREHWITRFQTMDEQCR